MGEHKAVREAAGVFDVSHMGQLELSGVGAHDYLQGRLSNDLDGIAEGQAQYTLLTNERGGIVDDLIAYRRGDDDYLLVVNASNVEPDHAALDETDDVSTEWALLAVQGPEALDRLGIDVTPFTFGEQVVLGVNCLVAGTGYTGERGCELGCALTTPFACGTRSSSGASFLAAWARGRCAWRSATRCTGTTSHPSERPSRPASVGRARSTRNSPGSRFCGVRRGRAGGEARRVRHGGEGDSAPGMSIAEGGEVTSGSLSPMLDMGIGLGVRSAAHAAPETQLTIDVRGARARRVS